MIARRLPALAWSALLILGSSFVDGPPAVAGADPAQEAFVQRLKAAQQQRLMQGARGRLARYRARSSERSTGAMAGARRRLPPDATEAGGPQGADSRAPWVATAPEGPASPYPNVLVNNRAGDFAFGSGQSEVSIAAHGNHLVAAWNDGEGFATGLSTQGYAYSTDGGATWVDGGIPPTTNVGEWTSDPVIAVNEKTGEFYYSALCQPSFSTNGIGVVKGTFAGGVLTWQTPELAISGSSSSVIYDKEWLAADSTTGNLYLIYSRFTLSGAAITTDRIDFQRRTAGWSAPITLSSAFDAGRVQGARVAVGPAGEVWATWNAIGSTDVDFMRVRRSTTQGSTFGVEVAAVSQYTNFGSGAPGFNRGFGIAFPGITVDRTNGPNRGRAYLAWNESINFYNDPLGNTGTTAETESNDSPGTADAFTVGRTLTGTIASTSDFDYWSFTGTAGQTLIAALDLSSAPALDAAFRLFCTDGATRLAFSQSFPGGTGLIVFTLPTTGIYYLRVAPFSGSGAYSIITGLNGAVTERARDHRDVFVTFSDNGTTWSTPSRVNDDPGHFDDWLPEVAVAELGRPYVLWYDWRDAPPALCGGASHVYLARSDDGGVSWTSLGAVSDAQTAWTSVSSNIAPNQGDYIALFGNPVALFPAWADGRFGDPDAMMATIPLVVTPVQVSLASVEAQPDRVRLVWHVPDGAGFAGAVHRRSDDGEWQALGRVSPDGTGRIAFVDRDVVPGTRYHYRLAVPDDAGEWFAGEVTVEVPAVAQEGLAIRDIHPNPADREVWVSFSLAGAEPARLELVDVSGRRVRERMVSGTGRQTLDLAAGARLPPGVYLVRLTQAGRSVVTRVSVVR